MDVNEKVKQILQNIEFEHLRSGLGPYQADALHEFIRELISNHDFYYNDKSPYPDENLQYWRDETKKLAQRYVDGAWMQTPWLTKYLIKEVLDTQIKSLEWVYKVGVWPEYSFRHSLGEPYRTWVPPLLGIVFFTGLVITIGWLLTNGHEIGAGVVFLYFIYHYVLKVWQTWRRRKSRRKLYEGLELLSIVRHDLDSEAYDAETISRRLKSFEEKTLYPYSVIFSLLKIRAEGK